MKTKTIGIIAFAFAIYVAVNIAAATALRLLDYARPFTLSWQANGVLFAATALLACVLFTWAIEVTAHRE